VPEAVIPRSFHGSSEGVDNAEAGFLEIDAVSRDDRQAVDQRRGGDEAVFDGHSVPGGAKTCEQLRPSQACLRLPRQTTKLLDARVEPTLEAGTPPSVAQQENAEAQLAEDDGIYGDFTFVVAQPFDHFGIGELLGRLAEDVGVDQISHTDISQYVGRFRRDRNEKALPGTGEQPIDHAFIWRERTLFEPVFATIETFDVELLARFDPVLLPDLSGEDDLAFR
jgi:hypothetical protein